MASYYRYRYRKYRYRKDRVPPGAIVAVAVVAAVVAAGGTAHHRGHGNHPDVASEITLRESRPAAVAIAFAHAQLGKPYIWGATGPDGFDCSGLTSTAWRSAGIAIPRTSEDQWAEGHRVAHPVPGDLVFSYWDVDSQASPNHVQIYVGHGYVIGADTTDVERVPLAGDAGHIVGFTDPDPRAVTDSVITARPSYTPASWTLAFLRAARMPATTCNRRAVQAWIHAEGSQWAWRNPLDDELPEPGSRKVNDTGGGNGVMAYPSWGEDLTATALTLSGPDYTGIRSALRAGNDAQRVAAAVAMSPWGTEPYEVSC
jgi:hypothetical protein